MLMDLVKYGQRNRILHAKSLGITNIFALVDFGGQSWNT